MRVAYSGSDAFDAALSRRVVPTVDWLWPLLLFGAYALAVLPTLNWQPVTREAWRESDVLIVGRNYCRESAPLLFPRIDARENTLGITGMEFPLLNYVEGKVLCWGGNQVLFARVLTLLFALMATFSLFGLVHGSFGRLTACVAVGAFLSSPVIFYYGRSIMPDVPSIALALLGVWLLRLGLVRRGWKFLAFIGGSAVALSLGALIKLPSIVFFLVAVASIVELRRPRSFLSALGWTGYFVACVGPVWLWYQHAGQLQVLYGLYRFSISRGISDILADWTKAEFYRRVFVQHLFDVYAFPLVSAFALLGVGHRRSQLPLWTLAMGVSALAYLFLAGMAASIHAYYGVLVVPAISVLAAPEVVFWAGKLPWRKEWIVAFGLVLSMAYAVHRTWDWFWKAEENLAILQEAKSVIDARFPRTERVSLFSGGTPVLLWALDRKGWIDPGPNGPEMIRRHSLPTSLVVVHRRRPRSPTSEIESALSEAGCRRFFGKANLAAWTCALKY